ncbi:hypothetical protein COLO4_37727 [Corchorus olitorius]|uniref:Uncharacterized protein n=1 Tax=Corchorus olitorius TaxID=93759 RepID=A0A1R3FZU8_9ROSI|nr:hypothetical protein COLO4_37727 [Corchorus olitorius]
MLSPEIASVVAPPSKPSPELSSVLRLHGMARRAILSPNLVGTLANSSLDSGKPKMKPNPPVFCFMVQGKAGKLKRGKGGPPRGLNYCKGLRWLFGCMLLVGDGVMWPF